MAKDLDNQVQAFLPCSIERAIPHLFVDATHYTVRDEARYVIKAVLVVAGVRDDGTKRSRARESQSVKTSRVTSQIFCNLPAPCLLA